MSDFNPKPQTVESNVPSGYTVIEGPGGKKYLVPLFVVPSLEYSMSAYHKKAEMKTEIANADGLDPYLERLQTYNTIAGTLHAPPDPPLTDKELLRQHAEVQALVEKLGISYRDAAHRLYMAEMEKLKVADMQRKSFQIFEKRATNTLKGIAGRHNYKSNYFMMYKKMKSEISKQKEQ
ncbi:hypothetical protein JR316_0002986 [Psilocybe cubensis]|uniref:Uncharacterized protein n=4 Tax=Psilocybe cubensis TaxID=181762 RepID=A0A8H8CIR8_PSICU|nr:hypothetical protein JR316_0011298 [Psilocybe cubensis]XP_047749598.1 hypothetical protein JR316_0006503 [Psilocybe cubensis]XP_047751143.1 hypothetical protein JR316_0002986 [Psilocybe cubensis]KAH9475739.1 hypothetical protein JR316_0011298 [Psilocybe cubensis]KAH9481973.1 hypothetical protein JR316_0006503 [Psilocybe cubensis]KAH9483518.1 hypothetical protein JR316_0002986 [Psilocybe cubensis]